MRRTPPGVGLIVDWYYIGWSAEPRHRPPGAARRGPHDRSDRPLGTCRSREGEDTNQSRRLRGRVDGLPGRGARSEPMSGGLLRRTSSVTARTVVRCSSTEQPIDRRLDKAGAEVEVAGGVGLEADLQAACAVACEPIEAVRQAPCGRGRVAGIRPRSASVREVRPGSCGRTRTTRSRRPGHPRPRQHWSACIHAVA